MFFKYQACNSRRLAMFLTRMYACSNKHMLLRENTHGILIINDDNHCRFMVLRNTKKKSVQHLRKFFIYPWCRNCKNMQAIQFPCWLFDPFLRATQDWAKKCCWMSWIGCAIYLAGTSKIAIVGIQFIGLFGQFSHQVNIYQKRCQMLERLIMVFHSSRNIPCNVYHSQFIDILESFVILCNGVPM